MVFPFGLFKSEQASRKYIDLIYSASTTWANWDPSCAIKPGDFGLIDVDTGKFEKHDNIWDNENTAVVAKDFRPQQGPEKELKQIVSKHATACDMDVSPHTNIAGIAQASIKTQVEFEKKRGAVLILNYPRTSYVPEELLYKLEEGGFACLRRKVLVTSVFSCSSYAMYLSSRSKETVKIALLATSPIPASPAIGAGGEVGGGWWSSNHAGTFERAHHPTENYFPLYTTKTLQGNVRRDPGDPTSPIVPVPFDPKAPVTTKYPPGTTFNFDRSYPPWNPLDEEGKEIVYESESEDEDD